MSKSPALALFGDHCPRCGALYPVNAPLYRATDGSILCGGCWDATHGPDDGDRAAWRAKAESHRAALVGMRTSEVLRQAAHLLFAGTNYDSADRRVGIELLARAAGLENEAAVSARRCADPHRMGCCCDVLRAIGEVLS